MERSVLSTTAGMLPPRSCAVCLQASCHVPRRIMRPHVTRRTATRAPPPASAVTDKTADSYTWPGHDDFDAEDDRHDEPPLPLPELAAAKTVTLVRHGQSQWNASGRIQGSCDLSLLTDKGWKQAEAACQQLDGEEFDAFFCSPLQRAAVTGEIIWAGRRGAAQMLPALREVDLYSLQGLFKAEGKARSGPQYESWKNDPASFEIDGHPPVRELWYRASLALRSILAAEPGRKILVVAHNAVNQALIAVSLGLPPSAFRRLVQANAAITVLHFAPAAAGEQQSIDGSRAAMQPTGDGSAGGSAGGRVQPATRAVLRHLNQSPEVLSSLAADGPPAGGVRVLLFASGGGAAESISHEHLEATACALSAFQVDRLLCDDTPAAHSLQQAFTASQRGAAPPPQLWHPTQLSDERLEHSALERQAIAEALALCLSQSGHDGAAAGSAGAAGAGGRAAAGNGNNNGSEGITIAVVTSCGRAAALLHDFGGLGQGSAFAVAVQPAGISCIDVAPAGLGGSLADGATVHCMNSRAHLAADPEAAAYCAAAGGAANASDM